MSKKSTSSTNKREPEWYPDMDKILSIRKGVVFIAGNEQDQFTVENLKSEASMLKAGMLLELLGNTIAHESARYAIEEIKIEDTNEQRSMKLAFAQALAMWNKHMLTNIALLSKL